jgi:tol-pal system beta propeller repeat protein TolB
MKNTTRMVFALAAAFALAAQAETVVDVQRAGAEKTLVSVDVQGTAAFRESLAKNLALSGAFRIANPANASIRVTGTVGGEVVAEGRGRRMSMPSRATDDKAARMEARTLADKMCETYAKQKGFARDQIAFVCKNGRSEELCVAYPDGKDVKKLTSYGAGRGCVGPRWKNPGTLFTTGYRNGAPQVFEIDVATGRDRLLWGFGGLTTGATLSPDGRRAALILSKPFGNPELCTIDIAANNCNRMTTTRTANEGQPTWSPDGKKIAYVSDESRRQHLYIVDVATKAKRRITAAGSQNVDPDWGPDGSIAYTTKRGGLAQIAVLSPADGDKSARLVTKPGAWEHPTWTRDARHVVAERDGALFLVDTAEQGDEPVRLFTIQGRCITPSIVR